MKRRDWVLTFVDAAARKLDLGRGFCLMGGQNLPISQQDCIDAGASGVALARFWGRAIAFDHGNALGPLVAVPICSRYAKTGLPREPHDHRNENCLGRYRPAISA
jgi:hypothetical protein